MDRSVCASHKVPVRELGGFGSVIKMVKRGGLIQKIVSWLCLVLWDLSEDMGIGLGRVAPYVFGGIVWSWPRQMDK